MARDLDGVYGPVVKDFDPLPVNLIFGLELMIPLQRMLFASEVHPALAVSSMWGSPQLLHVMSYTS